MDITITIPRTRCLIDENDSFTSLKQKIKNGDPELIYFRLGWLPHQDKKIKNCYIIYKGFMRGYFRVKGFLNVMQGCNEMLRGRYVMLINASWTEIKPIKARGHRNFNYLHDISSIQEESKNIFLEMYEELERRCQGQH